jgi:hypothetical protein
LQTDSTDRFAESGVCYSGPAPEPVLASRFVRIGKSANQDRSGPHRREKSFSIIGTVPPVVPPWVALIRD